MNRLTRRRFVQSGLAGLFVTSVIDFELPQGSASAATRVTSKASAVPPASLAALSTVVNSQLQGWLSWLSKNNAKGVISECGWPNATAVPGDAAGWNQIGTSWLQLASGAGINVASWGSGRVWTPTYIVGAFTAATPLADVSTTQSNAQCMIGVLGTGHTWGTSLSGGERSSVQSGTGALLPIVGGGVFSNGNPGAVGVDYFYPSPADYAYVAAAGVRMVRLPIRWERIQPVVSAPLDPAELGLVLTALRAAAAAGVKLIPELHNGAEYVVQGPTVATGNVVNLGYRLGGLNSANFVDFWRRFSQAIASDPTARIGLEAYGLMNEPNTGPEAQPQGNNLFTNGSFTSGTTGWTPFNSNLAAALSPDLTHAPCASITGTGVLGGIDCVPVAVVPGQQLKLQAEVQAGSTVRQWGVQADWYDPSGTWLSQQFGDWPLDAVGKWATIGGAFVVPAGAATARIRFRSTRALSSGEAHYLTGCTIQNAVGALTGPQVWEHLSQDAVTAIRANGDNSTIWVAGHNGQSPVSWLTDHSSGAWITDPKNAIVYDAHHYFDISVGGSGVYASSLATEAQIAVGEL